MKRHGGGRAGELRPAPAIGSAHSANPRNWMSTGDAQYKRATRAAVVVVVSCLIAESISSTGYGRAAG